MKEPVLLAPAQLAALVRDIFSRHGMSAAHAGPIRAPVAQCVIPVAEGLRFRESDLRG